MKKKIRKDWTTNWGIERIRIKKRREMRRKKNVEERIQQRMIREKKISENRKIEIRQNISRIEKIVNRKKLKGERSS